MIEEIIKFTLGKRKKFRIRRGFTKEFKSIIGYFLTLKRIDGNVEDSMAVAVRTFDRIARLQLVRAILAGWLAPLENLTFITSDDERTDNITFRQRLLKEQQEMLAEVERKKKLEVAAIAEVIQKQTVDNADLLKRALKRGDVLEKAVYSKNGEFDLGK